MFGLSRLMELAGAITWRPYGGADWRRPNLRTKPRRCSRLDVLELEIRVVPTLLGQQVFPADYPWNQNISNAPLVSNSAAIISHIGGTIKIHPDWGDDSASNGSNPLYGIPFNVVHGNSPSVTKVNVIIDNYPGESDIVPIPMPANPVIEGDFQNGPNPNGPGYNTGQRGDSHLIVWDEDNNVAYELFGAARPTDPTTMAGGPTGGKWHAAQESVWDMKTDSFRSLGWTSADAAGLSILAGLVRPDEGLPASAGAQGAINHALRFTLPSGDVAPQYIYPASHVVSVSSGSTRLPFGARLRLQNTPAVNAIISALGQQAQIIAHAMQQYGLVLADIGSAMYVTGSSASQDANNAINFTWDMNDVLGLRALTAGNFDVIDLSPRVTGLTVNTGATGSTVTVIGQNFSGAAGHLSVFFGSTAATTVTFVDDSHLTVVVPNGSGTVHVTVQSGVNATDPNNPNDNARNPIFGYGVSATSAADQFTFSNQNISGSNSTVSFANSTVASGNTDALTIVVKDSTNSPVGGLTNAAFNFALSGGTSAGTFGTVTETAIAGTYTALFTATTSGTASTLTTTISGVTLTTKPTITVTPGSVSGAKSTVGFASPTVTSGNTDAVTIVVKDAASNAIAGLTNSAFSFSLSGGTSTGSFGSVTETATKGTYTETFTAGTPGTVTTLTATVNGVVLNTKPTVQVTVGGVSGANSTVSFASPTVASGNTDTVTIVVKDGVGNAITGLANSAFSLILSGGTSAGTFGTVTEAATQGTYTAAFTGTTAGTVSTLTTTISSVVLTTKPTITVTPGSVSGGNSTVSFASPTVAAGNTDAVTIVVKDAAGNAITGLTNSAFNFGLSGGTSTGTLGVVTETATKGTYAATFTGTTAGTVVTLTATVSSVVLNTKPTVQVITGGISGANSTVSFANPSVASGTVDTVTILVKDSAGNAVSGLTNNSFSFSLAGGTSTGSIGTVTETATQGTYTAAFTGVTTGTASTLTSTVGGVTLNNKPTVTVTAGSVSGANSTLSFAKPTVGAGNNDVLTVVVKDAAGNAISGLTNGSFNFTLTGGSSAGTFGSVAETTTKGTYTAAFTGGTPGTIDTLTATVSSVVLTTKPPIQVLSKNALYVNAVFQDVLGRLPDSGTLALWTGQLDQGAPRSTFVNSLDHSAEYYTNIITPAYQTFLGRTPDASGLAFWVGQMQKGMTDEQLEAGFIGSPEFFAHSGGTNKGWVDAMYQNLLGRAPDATGEAFWIQQLAQGANRAVVAFAFAASPERETQHITADYQKYLGRAPDAAGLSFWLDQFVNHGQTNENLITGFVSSDEYFRSHTTG
jgi:hypothetical protein